MSSTSGRHHRGELRRDSPGSSSSRPRLIDGTEERKNHMLENIGSQLRVVLCNCRTFIGTLAAYDKHMNLVLKNTIEYKKYVPKKCKEEIEEKRTHGFIILRGENIVSMIVEKSTDSPRSSSPSSASGSSATKDLTSH